MKSEEELLREMEEDEKKAAEEAERANGTYKPKPGDGFITEEAPVLDADGNPIPVDERLADPHATLEPVGWVPALTPDGKPMVSSKRMPLFTPPDDHRPFFINEFGQAETIVHGRAYTAKEAMRIFDLTEKTNRAEEQAMKNAEAQRKADARRAALNRVQ